MRKALKRLASLVAALVVLLALTADAEAKLGGGQSFRGGSGGTRSTRSSSTRSSYSSTRSSYSSSSRGSSSSRSSYSSRPSSSGSSHHHYSSRSYSSHSTPINWGGFLQEFQLSRGCCVLIVMAVLVIGIIWFLNASRPYRPMLREHRRTYRAAEPASVTTQGDSAWLWKLRKQDPNFSLPAFLDFTVLLYMRAQERLEAVRPYVLPDALSGIPRISGAETVCVGGANVLHAEMSGKRIRLPVRLETSATLPDGRTVCSHETWWFVRPKDLISKAPEVMTKLGCPSCGNPGECKTDGSCRRCGEVVTDGRFGWAVQKVDVDKRWTQRADEIGSSGGDGTAPPTAIDARLASEKRAFLARDPSFSFQAFEKDCVRTYLALQQAWTEKKFEDARPYESDAIFQTHRYWIEAYKRHRRTNVLKDVQVKKIQTVKVARDAFFDAITVRIWMSMIDYTKDDVTGKVLSGSEWARSESTEYWTFVRRSGAQQQLRSKDPGRSCPSCGAPVKINMAGICEHCETKVTSGEFGWVLSRIDQDSVYEG